MTENGTPRATLRIRITTLPKAGEMDEYDLQRFHLGEVYDVASHLASILILSGHAEPVSGWFRAAEAAAGTPPRRR